MPKIAPQLKNMRENITHMAGKEAADVIMTGSETMKNSTDKVKVAHWVKDAMKRMDETLDRETRNMIMGKCGNDCADYHIKTIEKTKKRRVKHPSNDAFLAAEEQNPQKGSTIQRTPEGFIITYEPKTLRMRCYCALAKGLPPEETMSNTMCECSRGFVERHWSQVLEHDIHVELLESAISGSDKCRFNVSF
jgi:predicted hydrocarbon binding protein